MKRLILTAGLLLAFCLSAHAQFVGGGGFGTPGFTSPVASGGGGFTPSCTSSSAFLARATTVTSNTDKTHYDTLLCTLQTASIGCGSAQTTSLDFIYILGAPNSTASLLNLCSSSFGLTVTGTPTFTANSGYSGGTTSNFLNNGYVPSTAGGNCALNSCSFIVYDLTNRTTSENSFQIGAANTAFTNISGIQTLNNSGVPAAAVNDGNGNFTGTTAQGAWVASRVNSTQLSLYRNAALISTNTQGSAGLPNASTNILNLNQGGTPAAATTDHIFAVGGGAGLTATQANQLANAVNAFATSLVINVY
jgi:hypothetical protein